MKKDSLKTFDVFAISFGDFSVCFLRLFSSNISIISKFWIVKKFWIGVRFCSCRKQLIARFVNFKSFSFLFYEFLFYLYFKFQVNKEFSRTTQSFVRFNFTRRNLNYDFIVDCGDVRYNVGFSISFNSIRAIYFYKRKEIYLRVIFGFFFKFFAQFF